MSSSSAVQFLNKKAEVIKKAAALAMNINAARGLQTILKSNLGPKGTIKMLVGGAGQIKLTKDGYVLLSEMQIQHPTAGMIARAASAQDDIVGDGTTSNVLFIGELLKIAERQLAEGVHPRSICDGYDLARNEILKFLDSVKIDKKWDRESLLNMAKTSLRTKVYPKIADQLAEICVDAILLLIVDDKEIDLHMVEIMHMTHKLSTDTQLIRGLVLDHGRRNPDMPSKLDDVQILTCNVSLEQEKTEVNSSLAQSSAEQKEKLVEAERAFTDEKVRKIIELKRSVCNEKDSKHKNFAVINQKGIDPMSLEMLAKEGITALRRAKRRNMERLTLAFGGFPVNSVDDLTEEDLGQAEHLQEHTLGDEKQTFIEGAKEPKSCTILIKGPNDHTIAQIKDACRDGLRAVKNCFDDNCFLPGAGAFEISASAHLKEFAKTVVGKSRLGIEAFADALLVIPRTLSDNSGLDSQEIILKALTNYETTKKLSGIDLENGEIIDPVIEGIYDNQCVKKQFLSLTPVLAQQLLLVDEVMRAGRQMKQSDGMDGM